VFPQNVGGWWEPTNIIWSGLRNITSTLFRPWPLLLRASGLGLSDYQCPFYRVVFLLSFGTTGYHFEILLKVYQKFLLTSNITPALACSQSVKIVGGGGSSQPIIHIAATYLSSLCSGAAGNFKTWPALSARGLSSQCRKVWELRLLFKSLGLL